MLGILYTCTALQYKPAFIVMWVLDFRSEGPRFDPRLGHGDFLRVHDMYRKSVNNSRYGSKAFAAMACVVCCQRSWGLWTVQENLKKLLYFVGHKHWKEAIRKSSQNQEKNKGN